MSDLTKKLLEAAEGQEAEAIEAAIEALEDLLKARTGKPRELLGAAAAAEALGLSVRAIQRSLSGATRNKVGPRVVVATPKGVVPAISRSDIEKWDARPAGRPRTGGSP